MQKDAAQFTHVFALLFIAGLVTGMGISSLSMHASASAQTAASISAESSIIIAANTKWGNKGSSKWGGGWKKDSDKDEDDSDDAEDTTTLEHTSVEPNDSAPRILEGDEEEDKDKDEENDEDENSDDAEKDEDEDEDSEDNKKTEKDSTKGSEKSGDEDQDEDDKDTKDNNKDDDGSSTKKHSPKQKTWWTDFKKTQKYIQKKKEKTKQHKDFTILKKLNNDGDVSEDGEETSDNEADKDDEDEEDKDESQESDEKDSDDDKEQKHVTKKKEHTSKKKDKKKTEKYLKTVKKLQSISTTFKEIDKEKKAIKGRVQKNVSRDVEKAFRHVERRYARDEGTPVKRFTAEERARRVAEIRERVKEKEEKLIDNVGAALEEEILAEGDGTALEGTLKSSLAEIELLLEEESGVDIDLSTKARTVKSAIAANTQRFVQQRANLESRGGLGLYQDTDNDGISDYDEEHIYDTNPRSAFTAGGILSDGERVLLGLDVHSTSTARVAVESPKAAEAVVSEVFEVQEITLHKRVRIAQAPTVEEDVEENKPVEQREVREEVEETVFKGSALPNSFVTLYIFSTPIVVTVKTDETGAWSYTLDVELEEGDHEMYVASVNNAGKILAKSAPIPFVKTAEAVDFNAITPTEVPDSEIIDTQEYMMLAGVILLVIFLLSAVAFIGSRQRSTPAQ